MAFPHDSEEDNSQAERDLEAPYLASVQDLHPERQSEQTAMFSDGVPGRRTRTFPPVSKIIQLILIGSAIFIILGNLLFWRGGTTPTTTDTQPDTQAQISPAQETSTVRTGNATAIARETVIPHMSPQAIYQTYTQGKPLFRDKLTDFNNTYFYNSDTMKPDPGCVFQKDGLHITSSDMGSWIPCNNSAFPAHQFA